MKEKKEKRVKTKNGNSSMKKLETVLTIILCVVLVVSTLVVVKTTFSITKGNSTPQSTPVDDVPTSPKTDTQSKSNTKNTDTNSVDVTKIDSPEQTDTLKVYNDAVANSKVVGKLDAKMTDLEFSSKLLMGLFNKDEAIPNCTLENFDTDVGLVALDSGSVLSINLTDKGDSYIIDITLSDESIASGGKSKSYAYFMNGSVVNDIIKKANDKVVFKNAGGDSAELKGGKITATVDKTSNTITSATLTFTENFVDEIDLAGIPAEKIGIKNLTGTFIFDCTLNFK